jgi:hypothetical protein
MEKNGKYINSQKCLPEGIKAFPIPREWTHSGGIGIRIGIPLSSTYNAILFSVRPVISVPDQRVVGRPGETVTMECLIEAYPKGIHYWELGTGKDKL